VQALHDADQQSDERRGKSVPLELIIAFRLRTRVSLVNPECEIKQGEKSGVEWDCSAIFPH
jgi:hypothetical protein